jgi:SagB-type dehydrogenase family enzyme
MKIVDLASPTLRDIDLPHSEFLFRIQEKLWLPEPAQLPGTSLSDLLVSRQTRRTFKKLSQHNLNALLWYSARVISVGALNFPRWQHRPTPSAGGRHPIDLLVFGEEHEGRVVYLYDALSHALSRITVSDNENLDRFFSLLNEVIDVEQATVVWCAAQFARTLSRYENGESLVWRDAGALIANISLVAECLGLNCCAVGITGEPYVSGFLDSRQSVLGAGGVLVGQR